MLRLSFILSMVFLSLISSAQVLDIYQGNSAYEKGDIEGAQQYYQKALNENPTLFEGNYNLGNTNYRAGNADDAIDRYEQAAASAKTEIQKAQAFHNLGNTYFQMQEFEKSVQAYKDALRANPVDDETRYNLAYAQKMLKQQQQQQQENQDQQQDQENQDQQDQQDKSEEEKDGQDGENQDQENQEDKEKKDGDGGSEKDQDEKDQENQSSDKGDKGEEKKEQKQPKPINLSPREAEQLLDAAKEEDQKIQMQLRKKDQQGNPRKIEKDW